MSQQPGLKPITEKENLHPRNLHRGNYNFKQLCKVNPGLKPFVAVNQYQNESIDFTNPLAVIALNKALLKYFYGVEQWDIPEGYLCPPIPGRADYIHYMADLLGETNGGTIPKGNKIKVLDIGTGANCVYPLIGNAAYGWAFVGTDVDPEAYRSAKEIVSSNKHLQGKIDCRLQPKKGDIFNGIIKPGELFDLTVCNPPFHASAMDAQAAAVTKWNKLGRSAQPEKALNFGGKKNELWYHGGEAAFISLMAEQSTFFPRQCLWFSTLVSKKDTLPLIYKALAKAKALEVKTITMSQGQKTSRAVAWTFLNETEREEWRSRWQGK